MTKQIQKKIKGIFAFVITIALVFSVCSVSCFADTASAKEEGIVESGEVSVAISGEKSNAPETDEADTAGSVDGGELTENTHTDAVNGDDGDTSNSFIEDGDGNSPLHTGGTGGTGDDFKGEEDKNLFVLLYEGAMDNLSEILSLFSFIGTLLIAFIYKKGLLPLFSKTVTGIRDGIGAIKKESEEARNFNSSKIDSVRDKLAEIENTFTLFSESVATLEAKLAAEEALTSERKKLELIMGSQIELLYDIFMSSSLPEYKKEAVGAKFLQMREELKKNELAEEEK